MKTSENVAVVSKTSATFLSNKEGIAAGQTIRKFSGHIILKLCTVGRTAFLRALKLDTALGARH